MMIHAYHVIFGAYGFWMPNDPRGSWSDFVHKWELSRFGPASKTIERRDISDDAEAQAQLECERQSLNYPAVTFTGRQARAIGTGFANGVKKHAYSIHACSILPEHVHLVIARHRYKVEQIVNLLKGEATRQLRKESLHPLAEHAAAGKRPPTCWAESCWKVFLDDDEAIENAIRYVENNPEKEGKPRQRWLCTTAFTGVETNIVNYP